MRFHNITIGRYTNLVPDDIPRSQDGPTGQGAFVEDLYGGWIEGTRDDGSSWIMFFTDDGSPAMFWAEREEGAVVGEPINLSRAL